MHKILIRHQNKLGEVAFEVQRLNDRGVKSAPAVELTDPLILKLGASELTLGHELAWYLESYLIIPNGPNADRAERAMVALQQWGQKSFNTLFGQSQARDFYRDATRFGHGKLNLTIVSDDPHVLSWPWEALNDPHVGNLALHCRIERQLDDVPEPLPLPIELPQNRVNILLITARPMQNDVAYRSVARPLVELIHQKKLPAEVKLLRPPTFLQLQQELTENPGYYHIVHFDGHGGYGRTSSAINNKLSGPQGHLLFEDFDGGEDPVTANTLSQLLREHRIPIAVLNACQSAMLTEEADDAFASVATALLRAGVRSVVAMGYPLYVEGARQFLPAFYRELFRTGNVAQSVRSGRKAMFERPERMGLPLQDWLVPVLYQQDELELEFATLAKTSNPDFEKIIPQEAKIEINHAPYGLIGRDSAVMALERASRRAPAGLLIHGLGGIGKTTLTRGHIEWLSHTQGLPKRLIWQSLTNVRSFDYLRNRLIEELLGTNSMALPDEQKWPKLVKILRDESILIVWDNFESIGGSTVNDVQGQLDIMSEQDRQALKRFLEQLHGGRSKFLMTSRSSEQWLGNIACFRVALSGLRGEERRELARSILNDHGAHLDPRDQETLDLIDSLLGHPMMMRIVLPKLAIIPSNQLRKDLDQHQPTEISSDPMEQRLYSTLCFVEQGVPVELRPLLIPIGIHEGYLDVRHLELISEEAGEYFDLTKSVHILRLLESAGLMQEIEQYVYEMHPALGRHLKMQFLQHAKTANDIRDWERGFCKVMVTLALHYTQQQLHEQRPVFKYFGRNFDIALNIGKNRSELNWMAAIQQAKAAYALNMRNLPLAAQEFESFANTCSQMQREDLLSSAYHQLGRVAEEKRDLLTARTWYHKSFDIAERLNLERGQAITSHQLGVIAQELRDFKDAESWYSRSMAINERQGNDHDTSGNYHQLGKLAQEQYDYKIAETWFLRALKIKERLPNKRSMALTYHQLGILAQECNDFLAAAKWHEKSLEIRIHQGNEYDLATTYHQLGMASQAQGNLDAAEAFYSKSLAIKERQGNKYGAAITYHQLGTLAEKRGDFNISKGWYLKAIEIFESQNNSHGAAGSYRQLGSIAQMQKNYNDAEIWYRKSLIIFQHLSDALNTAKALYSLENLDFIRSDLSGKSDV